MYGAEARVLRRCLGRRRDGSPCRAWALWRSEDQLCVAHSGTARRTRRGRGNYWPYQAPPTTPARYQPCRCIAYTWPHRPGSGLCRWPLNPEYRLSTRAGTHKWPRERTSRSFRAFIRGLRVEERTGRWPRNLVLPPELAKYASRER